MAYPMGSHRRVLVLYTELAPYVLACLDAWVKLADVRIDVVRWPVNAEAPFVLGDHPGITLHDRRSMDDAALLGLAQQCKPDVVLASGWIDKAYLKVCRAMLAKGVPTCMTFDTAWRGTPKQWLSALLGRFWIPRTYSHAWTTGDEQAQYAARLGFLPSRTRIGFYAADVGPFIAAFPRSREMRAAKYPHRFVHVARYIPTKGQQVLCDAFADLCDRGLAGDWELHLVGIGECYEQVRNSPSGKHPRIVHRGFVQARDMPAVLADHGVSVLPSLYEPWGVVVQEHACMGLPLLLSDAVGAREFFLEAENGSQHSAGDKSDLQRSLLNMIAKSDTQLLQCGDHSAELGARYTPTDWARIGTEFLLST